MNELMELQTGQVPFISGLMAGFSLSVAAQILRSKYTGAIATACFVLFATSSLLFLVALYIDVGLTLRIAGMGGEPGGSAGTHSHAAQCRHVRRHHRPVPVHWVHRADGLAAHPMVRGSDQRGGGRDLCHDLDRPYDDFRVASKSRFVKRLPSCAW